MEKHRFGFKLLGSLVMISSLVGTAGSAQAHHGQDFLVVETYELPHPKEVYLISSQDYIRRDDGSEYEVEPGLLFGVTPRLALELHGHFAKESGDRFRYESVAPTFIYQLTPPASDKKWKFAVSAEYEIVRDRDETNNRLEGRLIMSRMKGKSNLAINLITKRERSGDEGTGFGYAVGFRPNAEQQYGVGLEAQGQFNNGGGHEVLLGLYGEPSERLTFKLGLGTGSGKNSPNFTVRSGFVFRF